MKFRNYAALVVALSLPALAAALILGACGKKASSVSGPHSSGTGLLSGLVTLVGSAGTPIVGATVTASSGATTLTNASGQFTLTIPADQNVRVDVTKPGYTLNQLQERMSANETRPVAVGLMAAGNTAAVGVSSGGSVTDPSSSATIALPPNFVTATGPVTATITGLDPTTDQIQALPGGLMRAPDRG